MEAALASDAASDATRRRHKVNRWCQRSSCSSSRQSSRAHSVGRRFELGTPGNQHLSSPRSLGMHRLHRLSLGSVKGRRRRRRGRRRTRPPRVKRRERQRIGSLRALQIGSPANAWRADACSTGGTALDVLGKVAVPTQKTRLVAGKKSWRPGNARPNK